LLSAFFVVCQSVAAEIVRKLRELDSRLYTNNS
jgi:hypothetical protein